MTCSFNTNTHGSIVLFAHLRPSFQSIINTCLITFRSFLFLLSTCHPSFLSLSLLNKWSCLGLLNRHTNSQHGNSVERATEVHPDGHSV
jgi:hypothetical protein